jgi:hypothetical protein
MAREIVYLDDLTGERNAETVRIGWNDVWFEVDLAEANRTKLTEFIETYINAGRPAGHEEPKPEVTRRTRRPRGEGASGEEKLNYSDPQNAGIAHRGRVTEAEAEWVRNNLDEANANRTRAGQPLIDPNDEKEKKRYGF